MPLIIIPLILAIVVGFSSGFISVDLSGSGNQEKQPLVEQIPATETLVIEPSLPSPTPTPKPQVAYKQPEAAPNTPKPTTSNDSDPIINCKAPPDSPCTGQSLKIKKSECLTKGINSCCQIGNGWKLMSKVECAKAQNNEVVYLQAKISQLNNLLAKKRSVEGSDRIAELERQVNAQIEKSKQDLEEFSRQTRTETNQFIQSSEENRRRLYQELDKSIAETEARLKQAGDKRKQEFYELCAGNVFTKYDRFPGRLRIERDNSLVKQYEDELAQCAFLYK